MRHPLPQHRDDLAAFDDAPASNSIQLGEYGFNAT